MKSELAREMSALIGKVCATRDGLETGRESVRGEDSGRDALVCFPVAVLFSD